MREEVIENLVDPYAWKDIKYKSENIDKILEWAMEKETKRVSDKYSNISNTVKHLKNLMLEFSKKADNLQKNLMATTRIQQTKLQINYYQQRIQQCLKSSEQIQNKISQKTSTINQKQSQANKLKRTLMRLKTENIKTTMKMQQIEQQYWNMEEKENRQYEKETRRMKKEEDRKMISCYGFGKSGKEGREGRDGELERENVRLEIQLFEKIDRVKQLRGFIQECFQVCRDKLRKQEKKSNIFGLAGSLLFKLDSKDETAFPKIQKYGDPKLIVYDVLKEKYRKHLKTQNKKNEKLNITLAQFMNFTPIQITGLIELKGGLKTIINKTYEQTDDNEVKMVKG